MILDKIVNAKKIELEEIKKNVPEVILDKKLDALILSDKKSFFHSVQRLEGEKIKVISEIKKASPSKGIIREDFDHIAVSKIYAELNVNAISVLTEKQFFLGSLDYLKDISRINSLPLLRKDFIIDRYQIKESKINGASAILLIASILGVDRLLEYIALCGDLGLGYIVEIHDDKDLDKALQADARVIGINNRDLRTFVVDIKNTEKYLNRIPDDKIVISESGVHSRNDVNYLSELGVDAILIGEALMKQDNIKDKYYELFGEKTK